MMPPGVETPPFVHRALLYRSLDEFVDAVVPFVRSGVSRGAPVLVVTGSRNAAALRNALGDQGRAVDVRDAGAWYTNPVTTMAEYRKWIGTHRNGTRLTIVGEPVWPETASVRREWARYESALNIALADTPVDLLCPYDAHALTDDVLGHARETHPEVEADAACEPSEGYVSPDHYPRWLGSRVSARFARKVSLHDLGALADVREVAAREAARAGVRGSRIADVVLAASEIAGNALRHGRPPASVHFGAVDGDFVCEIRDAGPGIDDPLAGWIPSENGAEDGWGLYVARLLADAVEVFTQPRWAAVRLHFVLT